MKPDQSFFFKKALPLIIWKSNIGLQPLSFATQPLSTPRHTSPITGIPLLLMKARMVFFPRPTQSELWGTSNLEKKSTWMFQGFFSLWFFGCLNSPTDFCGACKSNLFLGGIFVTFHKKFLKQLFSWTSKISLPISSRAIFCKANDI